MMTRLFDLFLVPLCGLSLVSTSARQPGVSDRMDKGMQTCISTAGSERTHGEKSFLSLPDRCNIEAIDFKQQVQHLTDTIPTTQDTIGIEAIEINRQVPTAEELYEQHKREYRIIYLHGDNKNLVQYNIFPPVIVLNVNKLYNHFSKSGKRARHLQQVLTNDFMQDKIKESWYPMTSKLTKLEGQSLEDFRRYYQPDFTWWGTAPEYERLDYVFKKLKNYGDSSIYIREYLRLPVASAPANTSPAKR